MHSSTVHCCVTLKIEFVRTLYFLVYCSIARVKEYFAERNITTPLFFLSSVSSSPFFYFRPGYAKHSPPLDISFTVDDKTGSRKPSNRSANITSRNITLGIPSRSCAPSNLASCSSNEKYKRRQLTKRMPRNDTFFLGDCRTLLRGLVDYRASCNDIQNIYTHAR